MPVPVEAPVLGVVEPVVPEEVVPDWSEPGMVPAPEWGKPNVPPGDEPLVVSFGIDEPVDPLVPESSELPPIVVEVPEVP